MWLQLITRILIISFVTVLVANCFRKFALRTSGNEICQNASKSHGEKAGFLKRDFVICFVFSWIVYYFLIKNDFLPSSRLSKSAWIILVLIANIDILIYKIPLLLLIGFVLIEVFSRSSQKLGVDNFLGAVSNFLVLYTLFIIGKKKYKEKIVPFGLGDVLFGTMLGFALGLINGLGSVSFALILSGITAGILKMFKKPNFMVIPLAPFFVSGAIIYILS